MTPVQDEKISIQTDSTIISKVCVSESKTYKVFKIKIKFYTKYYVCMCVAKILLHMYVPMGTEISRTSPALYQLGYAVFNG